MGLSRPACLGLALTAAACASTGRAPPVVDLGAARAALEDARQAGAPKSAAETYASADLHLKEAEQLVATRGSGERERSLRADGLASLAAAEARCAAAAARQAASTRTDRDKRTASTTDVDRLTARLKKSEEEHRRLEERVALLLRDLELTETEIIRTKARLKGIETRAEASSAIAEARILTGRLDAKGRGATLALCNENIAKAEQQLGQVNYGAAVFFAMKAQDIAKKAQEASDPARHAATEEERPSPQPTYKVKAKSANIRKGPELTGEVVAEAPGGRRARGQRGEGRLGEGHLQRGDRLGVAVGAWSERAPSRPRALDDLRVVRRRRRRPGQRDPVPPRGLGGVERAVRGVHQPSRRPPVLRERGHADGDGGPPQDARAVPVGPHRGADLLRHLRRLLLGARRQQHRELLPAVAEGHVGRADRLA